MRNVRAAAILGFAGLFATATVGVIDLPRQIAHSTLGLVKKSMRYAAKLRPSDAIALVVGLMFLMHVKVHRKGYQRALNRAFA